MMEKRSKLFNLFNKTSDEGPSAFVLQIQEMLDLVEKMHAVTMSTIVSEGEADVEAAAKDVDALDRRLNGLEETIRRDILLSISSQGNMSGGVSHSLKMLAMAKDVERMGDYAENIFRVVRKKERVFRDDYREGFVKLMNWTRDAFPRLRALVENEEMKAAEELSLQAREMSHVAHGVLNELMAEPRKSDTPVATAMMFGFQRRLIRHMFNIAMLIRDPYKLERIATRR